MNLGSLQKFQSWLTAKVYVQKNFLFFHNNVVLGMFFLSDSLGDDQKEIGIAIDKIIFNTDM